MERGMAVRRCGLIEMAKARRQPDQDHLQHQRKVVAAELADCCLRLAQRFGCDE